MPKRKRQHRHQHLIRLSDASRVNPTLPVEWPGASDPSLTRPDLIKFDFAEFASKQEPGKSKLKQSEDDFRNGPLGAILGIHHWAMEEFFWHGLPGDDWHPMEAYLTLVGDRFPSHAQQQLRHWKAARIGLFEVGEVQGGTLGLQEWDLVNGVHCGPPIRAITLNIGGINAYRRYRGQITLTYVAPWIPSEGLFCAMGYGLTQTTSKIAPLALLLGLRHPELAGRPYPWKLSWQAGDQYLRQWQMREWHGWLAERLEFPFGALVPTTASGKLQARLVTGLLPMEPAAARNLGIYFEVPAHADREEMIIAGATSVLPLDIASPNWLPMAEYHEYRHRVGPPPGTRGQSSFVTFDRSGRSRC